MNFLVSANEKYMYPLKVMLTSLLESNPYEHHCIYFLHSAVSPKKVHTLKSYIERQYDCDFFSKQINEEQFADFPVSHHFSIETYYRFLVQDVVPASENRVLWLDVDMIVRKPLKDFYYQDFEGSTLIVCRSINNDPKKILTKLGCPEGTVYFNAGTILFNLELLRGISLKDYHEFYNQNYERITWLDQDILNAMYALKTKVCDYRKYNMQMFSDTTFTEEDLQFIEQHTAELHYIGAMKPWHNNYLNPCKKYWTYYEKKAMSLGTKFFVFAKKFYRTIRKLVLTK